MSADDYYTIKWNREDRKFYVLHGFMSRLNEGVPAMITDRHIPYETFDEALDSVPTGYSEYGLLQEPDPLDEITMLAEFRTHLEQVIEQAQAHLDWMNEWHR